MDAVDLEETHELNNNADESSLILLVDRIGENLSDLLQGQNSLGKYIEDGIVNGVALKALPSDTNPDSNGHGYFDARDSPITNGYKDKINVFQIKMPSSGRLTHQSDYSIALAEAFIKFYERYFGKYSTKLIKQFWLKCPR